MHLAVIIPNWNGRHHLGTCLSSLRHQTCTEFGTVVVDNGSTDGSPDYIRQEFPEVRVIELPENRGFSAAVNTGIRQTSSEIVVLLNNDTEAEPQWLAEIHRAAELHPEADMFACKLLLFDRRDVLHSAGDFYGQDGVPGSRGVWTKDDGRYGREERVFGACGGAAAYRRSLFTDIGLFDEDFIAYCEDVDLNWRALLAGHKCLFVPTARVYHKLSATGSGPFASYYVGRNMLLVMAKSVPTGILARHWPAIVKAQLRFAWESLHHFREPAARARLRGQFAGLRLWRRFACHRGAIEKARRLSIDEIEAMLSPR